MSQQVIDMQNITARYFVTCLVSPDTFDLINDIIEVNDISNLQNANPFAGGDIDGTGYDGGSNAGNGDESRVTRFRSQI